MWLFVNCSDKVSIKSLKDQKMHIFAGGMLIDFLHNLDQDVTLWLNGLHCGLSDYIFMFFSNRLVWAPLYLFVAWLLVKRLGWKRGLVYIAACCLMILCCDQFANLIKHSVERLRPCWDEEMVSGGLNILEKKGGQFGFFSAHASNALGFAICAGYGIWSDRHHRNRAYMPAILTWAFLVGISRVFVGKHYLGDVFVGFLAGWGFGLAFGLLARWASNKWFPEETRSESPQE